ncbi:MAG: hypothetical protein ABII00_18725 [Elusimicrobiota bacterium]
MADCKICGCKGWLALLDDQGLCRYCAKLAALDIEQRSRIVKEFKIKADTTLNPASKIQSMDLMASNLEALSDYERKGVATPGSSPQRELSKTRAELDALLLKTLRSELDQLIVSAKTAESPEAKLKLFEGFRLKLSEYKGRVRQKGAFETLEGMLRDSIVDIRLNAAIETARRAEENGARAEALRLYKKVLAELNTRDPKDRRVAERRPWIEEQIRSLEPRKRKSG